MLGANYKKTHHQEYTEPVPESARGSVIRTFEELRQSLQLNNAVTEHRQSQMSNRQSSMNRDRNMNASDNGIRQSINQSRKYQEPNSQYKATVPEATNENNEKEHKNQTKEALGMMDDHKVSLEELRERYQTDYQKGLSSTKATQLNEQFGDNKLSEKEREPLWKKFLKEVSNGFAIMLWVGAALCILVYILQPDDPSNLYLGIVLILVIFLTGYITFQQTAKSEALMESFKNFLPQQCTVIRDGENKSIDALKLVVGDVVLVKAGEKIPADIRILMSNEMKVDNSPLTGESEPLLRTTECTHPENPLETSNLAFFGTLCKEGQGKGVVVRIGDNTTLGQIADLSSTDKKVKSPLRQELDRFVIMITIIALFLGVLFFLLAWLLMHYNILQCLIFGIGILVANVPEGLLGCITISLAITAKTLSEKNVLVKNLEAVETLGSTSCICSDKTGTLTQNVMTVEHMWYNDQVIRAKNKSLASPQEIEYDETEKGFQNLHYAAMCSSEARFDLTDIVDRDNIDYMKCPVMGDATETGLVRFYQYIEDIEATRNRFKTAEHKGQPARMPFNSTVKFALTIVEQKTSDSDYCIYMKGAPEKVWLYCSHILVGERKHEINQEWKTKFDNVNKRFGKKGERVLGFAKLHLLREEYPQGSTVFNVTSPANFNFKLAGFSFCGLVSLIDPPKTRVPNAILECRSAGIKVIMQQLTYQKQLFILYSNYYGFTPDGLFNLANVNGYEPDSNAFNWTTYPDGVNPVLAEQLFKSPKYFNTKLYNAVQGSGKQTCTGVDLPDTYNINWSLLDQAKYDLRKALLKCQDGYFQPMTTWNDECNLSETSPVTDYPVCYSIDANFYAQTAFFVAIVLVQWSNVFACKSRKMSFTTSPVNKVMFLGILVETILCIFLFYTPGVQKVFGARPLEFWQFGIPGLPFSILLLLWEELRKFFLRTSKWFNKHCLW
ncbi:hypothetical protein ABPG73_013863 [Tetrahymena malaccensis]